MRPPHLQLSESFGWRPCPVCGFGPRQPRAGVVASSSRDFGGWNAAASAMPQDIRWKITANDERFGLIARCSISGGKISRVSFQPMIMVTGSMRPEPLSAGDRRSDDVARYVEWVSREAGMHTGFRRDGDDIAILLD